jgi:phospholipase/carboxylesterase
MNQISKKLFTFIFLVLVSLTTYASGESFISEVKVHGHRCIFVDPKNLPKNAPVVFILHGLGANADDLFPLIQKMNLPRCRYVLPDAPISLGNHGYAWYDFQTQSYEDTVNSRAYLFDLMKIFSEKDQKSGHACPIILMGFSQGGVMSMEAGLNYSGKVLAIVSMSGYIWNPVKTLSKALAPKNIPILMVHGTNDLIVPEPWTQKTLKGLKEAGYYPILKEFPMGHQISPDSLSEVSEFLRGVINHK